MTDMYMEYAKMHGITRQEAKSVLYLSAYSGQQSIDRNLRMKDVTPEKDMPKHKTVDGGKVEIFKFQRPIMSTDPNPEMLVYNESGKITLQVPFTKWYEDWFGDELKIYAKCRWQLRGKHVTIEILNEVEDEDW